VVTSEVVGPQRRKIAAVLRLLKRKDLDTLSRELKVNASTLSSWRDVFLANCLAGLKSRELDGRDEKIARLQKVLGRIQARMTPGHLRFPVIQ
jgi:hypothetical protein